MIQTKNNPADCTFLQTAGLVGKYIREYNWDYLSIGPPPQWPQTLRGYVNLVLNAKSPMCLFWGNELICFYNDAHRSQLGSSEASTTVLLEGKQVWHEAWEIIHPIVNEVMDSGEAAIYNEQLLPVYRNGSLQLISWNLSFTPVIDEFIQRAGVMVMCAESGNGNRNAQDIAETTETTRLAIEAGELGVVEINLQTDELILSERVEEIFGLPPGSKRAEANNPLKRVSLIQDITVQKQFSHQLSSLVRDRTEKLENAHENLLSANSFFQKIINIFTTALQVLEPVIENGDVVDFRYVLANQAYAGYAQKRPEELTGRRVSELFPGYFDTDSFKYIREVAITGSPKIWENHYRADGLNIYNEMGAVKVDGVVVVHLTDFTKLKHLQFELERNITELKRSNENLEEFAYAASHDLKEPIRKIQIFNGQLRDQLFSQLTQSQQRSFERVQDASVRMANLIDDLLMYSHISKFPRAMEAVQLSEVVAQVLEDLEFQIQEKSAVVSVTELPVVYGYKRQLQQLLQNLISNAIKYSRADVPPVVNISAAGSKEQGQEYNVISIQDNGIGFDDSYREKIFQMFTRLHNKNEYSGTGIGLSIVKKVVENHRGYVLAQGSPGEGSLFKVFLPVASA